MKRTNWFDRKFDFSHQQDIFPSILERLEGTPIRLREKLLHIPTDFLTVKVENKWSILENIGHLTDLEPLWQGRLTDILNGETYLRATDLQNNQTDAANHNASTPQQLLAAFAQVRQQTLSQLSLLNDKEIVKFALHPRLNTPMRTMDLFLFVAEHDDHHLARITEIVRTLRTSYQTNA
jgi:uncharacterized damage-inducible protein DinB